MILRLAFVLVLLATVGLAQTAPRASSPMADYHRGARAFVDGDNAAALAAVEAGLAQAPDDARLKALRNLIEQPQDPQDDSGGDDQQKQDDAQNQESGDEGEPKPQSPQDGQPGQAPPPADEPEARRDQTNTAPPPSATPGQAPPQAGTPGEMTPAQADRILDAVGGEERLLLREIRRAPSQRRRSDKDW